MTFSYKMVNDCFFFIVLGNLKFYFLLASFSNNNRSVKGDSYWSRRRGHGLGLSFVVRSSFCSKRSNVFWKWFFFFIFEFTKWNRPNDKNNTALLSQKAANENIWNNESYHKPYRNIRIIIRHIRSLGK